MKEIIVIVWGIVILLHGVKLSSVGTGEHSGYITAVDQKGYVFKNYRIYFKTDNSSSQEDVYCIYRDDADLIEKAKEVNKNRENVVIKYKGVRGFGYDICDGSRVISID